MLISLNIDFKKRRISLIRKNYIILVIIGVFYISVLCLHGQKSSILDEKIVRAIESEISGGRAYGHVVNLSGWPKNRPEKEYKEAFYEYLYDVSLNNPRLTYDLLERRECKRYLAESRFQKIRQEAFNHYID